MSEPAGWAAHPLEHRGPCVQEVSVCLSTTTSVREYQPSLEYMFMITAAGLAARGLWGSGTPTESA